ncbi:MAG: aminotransferase class I/II-fold pyridoxal phosphate-dependent enzyme [Planctomycetes bacterium]|nr:aminotransferase class I/II-fold pyridoxal phosphate-dependent enzyme [Planctomycetota bacterium]
MTGPRPTRILEGLPDAAPFLAAEALERRLGRPLDLRLGANESAFGPSPKAVEALTRAAGEAALYGDPDHFDLRERLAQQLGVVAEALLIGAGIDEILMMALRAWMPEGASVVAMRGTYPMIGYHTRGFGGQLHEVPYDAARVDTAGLSKRAAEVDAKIVYLAMPDNPSGHQATSSEVAELRSSLPKHCLLILDEAYVEFADPDEVLPLEVKDPALLRLRTFSKVHGLAGCRVGYALAHPRLLAVLEKIRLHFAVNRPGLAAACAAIEDQGHVRRVVVANAEGRDDYLRLARDTGLEAVSSQTSFVLFRTPSSDCARDLRRALLDRGVFTRLPWASPLDDCVRISVGTAPQREILRPRFIDALASLKGTGSW